MDKRLVLILVPAMSLMACGSTVRFDKVNRYESYGFVTTTETKIYQNRDGIKVVGELPKYYNFKLKKELIEIDNGLVHIFYETRAADKDRYPDGWVKLNDVKLLSTWEVPVRDISTQKVISNQIFPVTAAKANQFIASYDKNQQAWEPQFIQAIADGKVLLGMNRDMVLLSVGIPDKVNITKGNEKVDEQWVYNAREGYRTHYVYFINGQVTNTQTVGENVREEAAQK
jgi:hypothetical protein